MQSASNTSIIASNLSAENAIILTGKLRDEDGIETITDIAAKLNIESAKDTKEATTKIERIKPNYVGIAVVAGASAWAGGKLTSNLSPGLKSIVGAEGLAYTLYSGVTNSNPNNESFADPLYNIRDKSSSYIYKETKIKTNLDFDNLITQ